MKVKIRNILSEKENINIAMKQGAYIKDYKRGMSLTFTCKYVILIIVHTRLHHVASVACKGFQENKSIFLA